MAMSWFNCQVGKVCVDGDMDGVGFVLRDLSGSGFAGYGWSNPAGFGAHANAKKEMLATGLAAITSGNRVDVWVDTNTSTLFRMHLALEGF